MNNVRATVFCCLLIAAASTTWADVVFLKSGGKVEGRIIKRTESAVEVDLGAGSISLSKAKIDRIEEGRSPLDEYDERMAVLDDNDYDGWLNLAQWASDEAMATQARKAYEKVLSIRPNDPEANSALGRMEVDGRWMPEDDAHRARGLVEFEGQWMTPAEKESAMREQKAAHAASEQRHRDADSRKRDAADAEAREAETQTAPEGIPLYWGAWGPGPINWPTRPVGRPVPPPVNRPIRVPARR